jgi:hypothetical protein
MPAHRLIYVMPVAYLVVVLASAALGIARPGKRLPEDA